jgi:hypothetical protein
MDSEDKYDTEISHLCSHVNVPDELVTGSAYAEGIFVFMNSASDYWFSVVACPFNVVQESLLS